jgi:hypothetical protein
MMAFNTILWSRVGADYAHERNNPDSCRGRFIAPTADVSAFDGWSDVRMKYSICIIAPTADYAVSK